VTVWATRKGINQSPKATVPAYIEAAMKLPDDVTISVIVENEKRVVSRSIKLHRKLRCAFISKSKSILVLLGSRPSQAQQIGLADDETRRAR
jgi:hypothetical protein